MTREAELLEIANFIERNGLKRCPPDYAAATSTAITEPEVQAKLAGMREEAPPKRGRMWGRDHGGAPADSPRSAVLHQGTIPRVRSKFNRQSLTLRRMCLQRSR